MRQVPRPFRSLALGATVAAVVALSSGGAVPALAQASAFTAEITTIDRAGKRVTLKASMGQQTMRVASGVSLDAIKTGDRVRVTFGQDGTESVITGIEVVKP